MASEVRIGTRALPEEELRKLPYFLKWVHQGMTGECRMAERNEPADVLLVDIDQESTAAERDSGGVPIIVITSDPQKLPGDKPGLVYPLRVADLERALEQAKTRRPGTPSASTWSQPSPARPETSLGNPAPGPATQKIADLLQPLLEASPDEDLRLDLGDGDFIVASPHKGYYATSLRVRDFATHAPDLIRMDWTATEDALPADSGEWKPIRQLVWLLAYYGARDGLLPHVPREGGFTLQAWPDYQVIPMEANNLKVWAYLKWHSPDAQGLAAATGVEWGQVLGSINAGWLCGQVRATESAGQGAREGGPDSGLFGKIRERLGLRSVNA